MSRGLPLLDSTEQQYHEFRAVETTVDTESGTEFDSKLDHAFPNALVVTRERCSGGAA